MKKMRSGRHFYHYHYVAITLFFISCAFVLRGQEFSWNDSMDEKIDSAVISLMEKNHFPGVAVAVVHKGRVLKESYYGLANIEYKVPVSDSTVFWMASISKHFDCAGILRLQQQGKLNVKNKIGSYLVDLPEAWQDITIEHLMTHTSGLPADGNDALWHSKEVTYGKTLSSETIYEILKKDTLQFRPGTSFLYSGSGYSVLSLIMEKVSGQSYKEFMQKNVFQPAGLQHTYTKEVLEIHPNQVTGYQLVDGKLRRDNNRFPMTDLTTGGGGSVYATLKDMIRWNAALNANDFLSEESKKALWTSYEFENNLKSLYGYGFNTVELTNSKYVYHAGIAGTEYLKFLNKELDILILTNLGQPEHLPFTKAISKILGVYPNMTAEEYAGLFNLNVDFEKTKDLERFAGNYTLTHEGDTYTPAIKSSKNGLVYSWNEGKNSLPLIPLQQGWLMFYEENNYFPVPNLFLLKPIKEDPHENSPIKLQMVEGNMNRVILTKVK